MVIQNSFKQVNLFTVKDYLSKEEIQKEKNKRGPYKKTPKKPKTYNPFEEMSKLYQKLANFLPLPLFTSEKEVFDFGEIRAWYINYVDEQYFHQGESFCGETFKVIEAEIKGTENFFIEERVYLHKKIIEFLTDGEEISDAVKKLSPLIQMFHSGLTLEDLK